jgi:hypothetical protein
MHKDGKQVVETAVEPVAYFGHQEFDVGDGSTPPK